MPKPAVQQVEAIDGDHRESPNRKTVSACAYCLIALGLLAELAWIFNTPRVTSIFPGWVRIDPTSAALFVLCGIAFLVRISSRSGSQIAVPVVSCAMLVIGGLKVIGYLLGQNVPVDSFSFPSKLGAYQGSSMAPNTAFVFVLLGLALPRLASRSGRVALATAAIVFALSIGIAGFVGFAFSSAAAANFGAYAPMALPTNLCLFIVGTGSIALRPDQGIGKFFGEDASGSVMVRRLLPVAVLAPFMISVVTLFLDRHHLLPPNSASALAIVVTLLLVVYLILGTAKTLNDIDHRRQDAEQQLELLAVQLREEAAKSDAANRSKSLFLANMSHEVRTPLNGVLGISAMLELLNLEPDVHRLVGIIRSSGETLLRVIDDILDFSKIEAGKLEIEHSAVNLPELVQDIVSLYQAQAITRGICIHAVVPEIAPPFVLADPVRIRQVLGNLISNAIKFTSVGGVYVSLDYTETSNDRVEATLAVKDSGIGIEVERQAVIFDSFTQADDSTHRRFGGTGLGLAICKKLVEIMDGEISVSSLPREGSTFTVRIGFQVASQVFDEAAMGESHRIPLGKRILLAEDNEVNAMVATALLESMGCMVEVVGDGVAAIAAVAAERFDAVLMDIHMPICDGLEATRAIRQLPKVGDIWIVALTASALSEDRQACLDAGIDGFLSKPFTREGLSAAILSDRSLKVHPIAHS